MPWSLIRAGFGPLRPVIVPGEITDWSKRHQREKFPVGCRMDPTEGEATQSTPDPKPSSDENESRVIHHHWDVEPLVPKKDSPECGSGQQRLRADGGTRVLNTGRGRDGLPPRQRPRCPSTSPTHIVLEPQSLKIPQLVACEITRESSL